MSSSILIFASEVSVICMLNPYRKLHDTFFNVWKRTSPHQIGTTVKSREENLKTLIKSIDVDGKISQLVENASTAKTIEEVKETVDRISSIIPTISPAKTEETTQSVARIESTISVDETKSISVSSINESIAELILNIDSMDIEKDICKTVESQIKCGFGTAQESTAISEYEKQESTSVVCRNDKFHKRLIVSMDGCSIMVGGRVDGIKEDGTVIEVKNRMRRFFDPLPQYDIAQLQTYLFILDASKGEIVEQLKERETNIKKTPIARDLDMWNTVIEPQIVRFCMALHRFMNDSEMQLKFIRGNESEREVIVNGIL
jgi:hypothetical protein